jgi:glutamine amidotransferase
LQRDGGRAFILRTALAVATEKLRMIVVVDLRTANVGSIANMLRRVGVESTVSRDPEIISKADRIIMPGVGGFDANAVVLDEPGLREGLETAVIHRAVPCMGICLGMQLMCQSSEEGKLEGLGWFAARVVRFPKTTPGGAVLRVPHMGWNRIHPVRPHPVFSELPEEARFYFVHSYHMQTDETSLVVGTSKHGTEFICAAGRDNILAVQFHPEKSHRFGMAVMAAFSRWSGQEN